MLIPYPPSKRFLLESRAEDDDRLALCDLRELPGDLIEVLLLVRFRFVHLASRVPADRRVLLDPVLTQHRDDRLGVLDGDKGYPRFI